METKPQGGYCRSRWNKLVCNVFDRQVRGRHGRAGSKLRSLSNIPMCFHIVNLGLKVFMDAHSTVTAEEGDRYPLRPPSLCSNGESGCPKEHLILVATEVRVLWLHHIACKVAPYRRRRRQAWQLGRDPSHILKPYRLDTSSQEH